MYSSMSTTTLTYRDILYQWCILPLDTCMHVSVNGVSYVTMHTDHILLEEIHINI